LRVRVAPPIGARKGSIPGLGVKPRLALALALWAGAPAAADVLRVGTSGDYPPFSAEAAGAPDGLAGIDVALVRAWADARGTELRFVRFRWPELAAGFAEGAFDVAAGGITVRPERSVRGAFTRPVVETGAVALVRDAARFPDAASLSGARIAVNAGGHLERVARARFPAARILAVPDNRAPPRLLGAGEADAALTDGAEAALWLREVPGATALGPFTRDAKAWWVRPDRPALARDLDGWLAEREADGTLAALRAEHGLGADAPRAADPLPALFAALRERLELQPLVAEAKRAEGAEIASPAQEERVLRTAVAAAREAALRQGRPEPPEAAVRAVFRAQIAAGRALQAHVLAGPPAGGPAFDLERELRPALARVSERIAALLVELPSGTPRAEIERRAREALSLPGMPPDGLRAIAEALGDLAESTRRPPG
jgi:cyclohexadienyl dehydratase